MYPSMHYNTIRTEMESDSWTMIRSYLGHHGRIQTVVIGRIDTTYVYTMESERYDLDQHTYMLKMFLFVLNEFFVASAGCSCE